MPITVELPDGTPVDFPDGTSLDVMKAAMQKHWWKSNDAKLAASKTQATPLPKQGEFASPVEPEGSHFTIPTPTGPLRLPSGGDLRNVAVGAGRRFDDILDSATQLFLKAKGDDKANQGLEQNIAAKRRVNEPLNDTTAGTVGAALPDIALTAIPAGKVAQAATAFPRATRALASVAGAGSINGLYDAATRATTGDETRAGNALEGFGWGALGQGVANAGGRLISGIVPVSKRAAELPPAVFDEATLGQVADRHTNAGRAAAAFEEKSRSIPFIGGAISNQRRRGVDAWRASVMNKAMPEGMTFDPGKSMADNIEAAQNEFAARYKAALAGQTVRPSQAFEGRVFKRATDPMAGLTSAEQQEVQQRVMNAYQNMFDKAPRPPTDPLHPTEIFHGGEFDPQSGTIVTRPLFGTKDPGMARSYLDMHAAQNGGETGLAVRRVTTPLNNPAPQDEVLESAKRLKMNNVDEYAPASIFDHNLQDPKKVQKLVDQLKAKGYDHAVMDDLDFNGGSGQAHIVFPGAEVRSADTMLQTSADKAKEFEALLTRLARQHRMSTSPTGQQLADIYEGLEKDWTSGYRSQLPLSTRQQLKPLDQRYAPFKTAERATTYVGNEEGNFTPNQLLTAVKARTTKPQFARRTGLLQEDADRGKTVFQDILANSGTADRVSHSAAAVGMVLDPVSTATALGVGKVASLPFTTTSGKNFMTGRTRAQMLLQKLRMDQAARAAGVPLTQSVEDLLEQ